MTSRAHDSRISSAWRPIVLFLLVHVSLAVLVPRTLKAMVTGTIQVKRKSAAAMAAPGE
jgi:hypothetical protein